MASQSVTAKKSQNRGVRIFENSHGTCVCAHVRACVCGEGTHLAEVPPRGAPAAGRPAVARPPAAARVAAALGLLLEDLLRLVALLVLVVEQCRCRCGGGDIVLRGVVNR
jgi:hypothetical protein